MEEYIIVGDVVISSLKNRFVACEMQIFKVHIGLHAATDTRIQMKLMAQYMRSYVKLNLVLEPMVIFHTSMTVE